MSPPRDYWTILQILSNFYYCMLWWINEHLYLSNNIKQNTSKQAKIKPLAGCKSTGLHCSQAVERCGVMGAGRVDLPTMAQHGPKKLQRSTEGISWTNPWRFCYGSISYESSSKYLWLRICYVLLSGLLN